MSNALRSVKAGETAMVFNHRFLPDKLNPFGVVHGGHIMALMDHVTGMTGYRFARMRIVTAAVEHMSFHAPVHAGTLLICHTQVNRVWDAAMEIGVRGVEEDFLTGEQTHVLSCYMTFVGLDEAGRPSPLPQVVPETDEERRRMADAARRMAVSAMERKTGFARTQSLELALEPGAYGICRLPGNISPVECMARVFPAQNPGQPGGDFLAVLRHKNSCSLVLEERAARALAEQCPGTAVQRGFLCLRMDAPVEDSLSAPMSGVLPLLAGFGIRGRSISMPGSDYLLFPAEQRERVLDILRGAGYSVRLPGV